MKLQHLTVIFILIIVPISLVMTQYIQTQIDTIRLQTHYTKSLNTATYDAIKAFQLNTINNKYSSLSDSKIRDIEASINTFYNSLKVSMNEYVYSKEDLSTFVPAILFTLYDGYYIHSSYNNIYTTTGEGEDEKVMIETGNHYQESLRPYIYYSCQYKLNNGKTVIVNYTLDNAITVYGDFGSGYETKSGYLIDYEKVKNIDEYNQYLTYDGIPISWESLAEHLITIDDNENETEGDYPYIVYKNKKVYMEGSDRFFWYDNYKKTYLKSEEEELFQYLQNNTKGGFRSISAYEYYKNAYDFSKWLVEESGLASVTQADIVQNDGSIGAYDAKGELYLSTDTSALKIFDSRVDENDPMLSSSTFNNHRMAVIRKSIETNLITAIANYNKQSGNTYEFVMPVIDEVNWDKITNNVSIISFMQGMPIGHKYYNNYSVITNTKNKEVINEQSVYVMAENSDGNYEYHQPGCKELIDKVNSGEITNKIFVYSELSFMRQTVKINEIKTRYFYPQARVGKTTTGCYNCIVNATGNYDIDSIISGEIKNYEDGTVLYNSNQLRKIRERYLRGLARERQDLYKSNFD